MAVRKVRREAQCLAAAQHGFVSAPQHGKRLRQTIVGFGVVRVQPQRALEMRNRLAEAATDAICLATGVGVGAGVLRVVFGHVRVHGSPAHRAAKGTRSATACASTPATAACPFRVQCPLGVIG